MRPDRTGAGHGKLLLFGEHAAVYGHLACGLTLPATVRVRIREGESDWRISGGGKPGPLSGAEERLLLEFLRFVEPLLPPGSPRGELEIESDLPVGRGFGSSAAWCAAFVRALLGSEARLEEVWRLAHRAEGFFHGTPSGIDTGLALLDGLYAFSPAPPALPEARPLAGFPLHLLVGALPRSGSTRSLVGNLKRRIESGENAAKAAVERLGSLSAAAVELLARGEPGDARALGGLAKEAQLELARLGLSTPALDALLEAGGSAGALGGKLSGAGGGGAFFLLFEEAAAARAALSHLRGIAEELSAGEEPLLYPYSWVPRDALPDKPRNRPPR